eukprot:TRINITY_DN6783_c0_g1_i2.p1 TRINITY_DN6783_c0_g1~~TRINITY_DN6783_c0_g1_i2.p1  ORF type:complete len:312 (+),score=61.89 TRINITY_DN6783_c0_g1_i2:403-1338(+)
MMMRLMFILLLGFGNSTSSENQQFGTQNLQVNFSWQNVSGSLLSRRPPVLVLKKFLTATEADTIVQLAQPNLVDSQTGGGLDLSYRNSKSTFLSREDMATPMIKLVNRRISSFLKAMPTVAGLVGLVPTVPTQHAEVFQVAQYGVSGFYRVHNDHADGDLVHYDRVATVLLYLGSDVAGGETMFPCLESETKGGMYSWNGNTDLRTVTACKRPSRQCNATTLAKYLDMEMLHCCCEETLRVKPKKGTALVFFPMRLASSGQQWIKDQFTAHAACPVRRGTKSIAQQWFHLDQLPDDFDPAQALSRAAKDEL